MKKFDYLIPLTICCLLGLAGYLGYHEFKKGWEISKQEQYQAQKENLQKDLLSFGYNPALADTLLCPPDSGYVSICVNDIYRDDSTCMRNEPFSVYFNDYSGFHFRMYFHTLPTFFELDKHTQLALLTNIYRCGNLHFRKEFANLQLKDIIDYKSLKQDNTITFNRGFISKLNKCVHQHINDNTGFMTHVPSGNFVDLDALGYISIRIVDANWETIFDLLFNDSSIQMGDTVTISTAKVSSLQ